MGKGKIVGTYTVKITLREPDDFDPADLKEPLGQPTNIELDLAIENALEDEFAPLAANVTSERTDV